MTINDYVGKLTTDECVDAFLVIFDALSTESLAVALGEMTWGDRDRLREALEGLEFEDE